MPSAPPPHSVWRLAPLCLLGAALATGAGAQSAAPAPRDAAWLRIEKPAPPAVTSGLPWIEVRGRAGARGAGGQDVVIALDLSDSALLPSGVDLDGDGPNGRSDPAFLAALSQRRGVPAPLQRRLAGSDFEDSILAAELAAAEALLERLPPSRARIGLVTFSDRGRLAAGLDAPRSELAAALAEVRTGFHRDLRGTNLADAIRVALEALFPPGEPPAAGRERTLLLLSDGAPTLPVRGPAAAALDLAAVASAFGVRIVAFALGPEAAAAQALFAEIASVTGGRMESVERPAEAIARLRRVDLADLEGVEIANLSNGEAARAKRVFPDGSFDAFVPLAPGENRLLFTATTSDGSRRRAERVVRFERAPRPEPERLETLLRELRRRTRETGLWADVERGRFEARRELELRADPPPTGE